MLVRDREWGTLEQILVTPARQLELILSKLIPLLVLCVLTLAMSMGFGIFWFGVPFQGSLLLYFWLALLFIASCLGLGLLISTRAKTQFEANASSMFFMLFGLLLSGLFYPRIGMPLIPAIDRRPGPLDLFPADLTRHLHQGHRDHFPVERCADPGDLHADRGNHRIEQIQDEAGLIRDQ